MLGKDYCKSTYHYSYYVSVFGKQTALVYTHSEFLVFNNNTLALKVVNMLISNRQFIETNEKSAKNPLIRDILAGVCAILRGSWLLTSPVLVTVAFAASSIKSSM